MSTETTTTETTTTPTIVLTPAELHLQQQNQRNELFLRLSAAQQKLDYTAIATFILHITRHYVRDNHFSQASQFLQSITFPPLDKISDPLIFSYFIYYKSLINAIHLKYAVAIDDLNSILRTHDSILTPFYIHVYRLYIIISLLMGVIPDRTIFNIPLIQCNLSNLYFDFVQSVRLGDVAQFNAIITDPESIAILQSHNTYLLSSRLRPIIVRAGLKQITKVYTSIPLSKITSLLSLKEEDTHAIVAKAILDDVIQATIDSDNILHTTKSQLKYISAQPKNVLIDRIDSCLTLVEQCQINRRYFNSTEASTSENTRQKLQVL